MTIVEESTSTTSLEMLRKFAGKKQHLNNACILKLLFYFNGKGEFTVSLTKIQLL